MEGRDSSFTVHVPLNIRAYYLLNTRKPRRWRSHLISIVAKINVPAVRAEIMDR